MSDIHDTIIARASAPGSAIRGILRISGKCAVSAVKVIVESPEKLVLNRHSNCVETRIILPSSMSTLPSFPATLLFWQEGHCYTGDETVEIHTIGSPVLLDAVMAILIAVSDSVRLAEPGEFTLRAFLSGRLDLAQAEAVLGIIDASNNADLKTALHQLAGNVSAPLTAIRTLLFETLVRLEASLEFAEEEIPTVFAEELQQILAEAFEQIEQLRRKITSRGIGGDKSKILLAGLPNAGKSTLFNKFLHRDAALVSPTAGTTRDYLEAEMDWEGIPIVLIDTAGIGEKAQNELDETVQRKAQELLASADVVIHCYEDPLHLKLFQYEKERGNIIYFQTKTADECLDLLKKEVSDLLHRSSEFEMLPNTALRCQEALISACESLNRARTLTDISLTALELRSAVNQLGLIDGSVHTEDILGSIFSRFCIGK